MLVYWINSATFPQLQQFWWVVCAVFGAFFLTYTFVQGAQSLLCMLEQDPDGRKAVDHGLSRHAEISFSSFVLFGATLVAAFPRFFITSFDGAYLLWISILFSFIFQAVIFELHKKTADYHSSTLFGTLLSWNGTAGVFLVGVALGSMFTGSEFVSTKAGEITWSGALGGLEAVFSLFNICFGLFLVWNARILGAMYLLSRKDWQRSGELEAKLRQTIATDRKWGMAIFAYLLARLVSMDGVTLDRHGELTRLTWKYLLTLNDIPGLFLALFIGLVSLGGSPWISRRKKDVNAFQIASGGTFLVTMVLLAVAGLDGASFYPSIVDLQSSLTVFNSSAGLAGLRMLTYLLLLLPLPAGLLLWIWWSDDRFARVEKIRSIVTTVGNRLGISFKLPNLFAYLAVLIAILLLAFPPSGLTGGELKTAALTIVAVGFWATGVLPAYLTAFGLFLCCMLFHIVPASVVFSGFASAALWLIFSGLILGIALRSTGLGERIAARIASGLRDREYIQIIGGVVAFGVLLGFIMPSAMGRIVLFIPIALALAETFGFEPGSNGRTGVIIAATFGSTMPASAILPSNVPNMVMAGTAETIYNISPLYGEYLLLHFPFLGLAKAVLIVFLVARMFPDTPVVRTKEQVRSTPWSSGEVKLSVILVVLLILWLTDFVHHISPAWVALAAAFLLLMPKGGLVSGKQFNEKVNYGSLFFVAGVLGLGAMVAHSGLGSKLANGLLSILPLKEGSSVLNYLSLCITGTLTGVATTVPGAPAVLTPLAGGMAKAAGLPIKSILMSQVLGFSTVIFPYQAPPLVVGMQLSGEKMGPAIKFCLILAGLTVVLLLPVNFLWWKILGWM